MRLDRIDLTLFNGITKAHANYGQVVLLAAIAYLHQAINFLFF